MREVIVIIGGGHCGTSAAFAAREMGFIGEIILLCQESEMPYERPPLSKWDEGELYRPIFSKNRFTEAEIDVRLNTTVVEINPIDKKVKLDSGLFQNYTRLLIATGAGVKKLSENKQENVFYLRNLIDAQLLSKKIINNKSRTEPVRVALIGGGFIGLELAASIVNSGARAVVFESSINLLSRVLPKKIASVVKSLHESRGVIVRIDTLVSKMISGKDRVEVYLRDGSKEVVDLVIVGIGSKPEVKLADCLKLKCQNGIEVNRYFSTEIKDIFAAGDCCAYPNKEGELTRYESWQVAGQQGIAAGKNLAGVPTTWSEVPYFWSDQYDYTIQMFGEASPDEFKVVRKIADDKLILFALNCENKIKAAVGIGQGTSISRDMGYSRRMIDKGLVIRDIDMLADVNIPIKKI